MEKMQPALRAYLIKLREEAFIDIKPGYIDTGASPNQTKPIYRRTRRLLRRRRRQLRVSVRRRQQVRRPRRTVSHGRGSYGRSSPARRPQQRRCGSDFDSRSGGKTTSTKPATTASMKPGKKEKIRYGQAPRETLPPSPGETEHVDAGSTPPASQQTAEVNEPANPLTHG